MKSTGYFLLAVGLIAALFSLTPDQVFINWYMKYNTLMFINNFLAIIASFFIPGGIAALIASKKRRELDYH